MTQPTTTVAQERPVQSAQPGAAASAAATAQIITLSELHPHVNTDEPAAAAPAQPADGANPLHHVKATVTVCVGSTVLSVGELLKARKDQVLRLDSAIHDPVDLLIEGKVVARGQLVAMGDRFAVRITQLPQALQV